MTMQVIRYNNGAGARHYLCQTNRKWVEMVAIDSGRISVEKALVADVERKGAVIDYSPALFSERALAYADRFHIPVTGAAHAMLGAARMEVTV